MWMPTRTYEHEYMDDHTPEQAVVDKVYAFLRMGNRIGGAQATLARFEEFARRWPPGARIEVLDVASGAADIPRALIAWGRRRGFDVRVTALDLSPGALDYARRTGVADERLRFLCADVHRMACRDGGYDYVTCALFFHHLTDEEIVRALRSFDRLARRGLVVNDLIRRERDHFWVWLLTRPFHPILRHDGPLSVRKSLRPGELAELARRAGLPYARIREHFGHRMTLAGEKR